MGTSYTENATPVTSLEPIADSASIVDLTTESSERAFCASSQPECYKVAEIHHDLGKAAVIVEVEPFVRKCEEAWEVFVTGDPEPAKTLFSRRDDVVLANPWGPAVHGWEDVSRTLEAAAARFRNGRLFAFDVLSSFVSGDLAWYHEIERGEAMLSGRPEMQSFALRVTSIYRQEDGEWKILLRHADPIVAPRPQDAVLPT